MKNLTLAAIVLAVSAISTMAQADSGVKMSGGMLVNASGMTLYTFDNDVAGSGKSVCNGPCATLWPPAMVSSHAKDESDFSAVTRDDGSKQLAYKGKPIYTYITDKKAGDVTGDNFKNVWHIIKQ